MTRQYWANLALCLLLGALAVFSVTRAGSALTPKGLFATDPRPSREAADIFKEVVLTRYQLGESANNMVEADFYVQNKSDQTIKNIKVLCQFYDEDGMYRDRKTWLLAQAVPPMHVLKLSSASRRFVNTGATNLNCAISDFQVVKAPFFSLDRHMAAGHGQTSEEGHGAKPSSGH